MDIEKNAGELSDNKIREFSALNLAYIGDTVYDLYVRTYIVKNQMGKVQALHKLASGVVNARAQAQAAKLLLPQLTERETEIFGYGKNTKSRPPKNMNFEDYSLATAIEAVIGYLYLTGQTIRMDKLFDVIIANFISRK